MENSNDMAYELGKLTGQLVGYALIVGIVFLVIYISKRNKKKKEKQNDSLLD